jgi:hypothetical protein
MAESNVSKFGALNDNFNNQFKQQGYELKNRKIPIQFINIVTVVRCKDCKFARERYGKLECINGISYRNTYNDPNMFCSYGERKGGQE